jgi:uncharacterized protein (TIGR00661 family)
MARIYYSMCGEGRGHAARVRAIVEELRQEHELVLFAPEQAHHFLAPRYPEGFPGVQVRRIPGLRFHYQGSRLDLTRTLCAATGYLWKLPRLIGGLERALREERPDLVISDFEPALPRAARRCGIPFLSLNHQHFLVACDLSSLPAGLRWYARGMKLAVKAHHRGQARTIVSSFFRAPLRPRYEDVVQVGPILRREIREAERHDGEYVLSYLRASTPPQVLEALQAAPLPVRVYGLGEQPRDGKLSFHNLDERSFTEDLAGCAAVVGAAGNQTLGESLYLGKPVLALPEERHHEQLINAHFLAAMGAGQFVTLERFVSANLAAFLHRLDEFRSRLAAHRGFLDGTSAAVREIGRFLPGGGIRPKAAPCGPAALRPQVLVPLQSGFCSAAR